MARTAAQTADDRRDARAALRGQGDRGVHRLGRRRQDHHRRGARGDGRGPPRHQGARAHRRPGTPAGERAGHGAVRQRRDPGARRAFDAAGVEPRASCGRPCSTPSSPGTT